MLDAGLHPHRPTAA